MEEQADAPSEAPQEDFAARRRSRVSFGPATVASETSKPPELDLPSCRAFARSTDQSASSARATGAGTGDLSARPDDDDDNIAARAARVRNSGAGRGRNVGASGEGRGRSASASERDHRAAAKARRDAKKESGEAASETLVDAVDESTIRANRVCI